MSLFTKKSSRRNIRRKVVESDEEGEEEGANAGNGGPEMSKTDPMTKPPRSLLSFGDDLAEEDGGGAEFKVKKTAHSRRAASRKTDKPPPRQQQQQPGSAETSAIAEQGTSSNSEGENESLHTLKFRLSEGTIPDASMIHAARKKREIARQLGGNKPADYLALNTTTSSSRKGRTSVKESIKGSSRLVREDDFDKTDSESEEGPARTFGARKNETRQMRVITALEGRQSDAEEDDEETKLWEEEQISKGMKASTAPAEHHQQTHTLDNQPFVLAYQYPTNHPATAAATAVNFDQLRPPPPSSSSSSLSRATTSQIPHKLLPVTIDSLRLRLQNRLSDLQETHSTNQRRMEQITRELDTAQSEIAKLEQRSSGASVEYQFYQELRGYVRDLLSCLTEKLPVIERLEEEVLTVQHEQRDLIVGRRRQDVRDQAEETSISNEGVLQEVGVDQEHRLRAVEREGRRRRRREQRDKKTTTVSMATTTTHYDGQSSDDELLETDRMKFNAKTTKLLAEKAEVFSDVVEDFCKLSIIMDKFEAWKFGLPESYGQAFVSLCLPKVFAPLVRLQLVGWNPLQAGCEELEEMQWLQVLMFYGFREGEEEPPVAVGNDEDTQLIPELVSLAVLPRIAALLRQVWDPLSSSQTERIVIFLSRLMDDYPTVSQSHAPTQQLLSAATLRLREAVDNDVFIPLCSNRHLENPSSQRFIFYQRQFWSCVKLLDNITMWEGLVATETLQELAIDGLLNRYLLMSLQNSPFTVLSVAKTQTILSCFPESWFHSTEPLPLGGLVRFLVHLAGSLSSSSSSSSLPAGQPLAGRQKLLAAVESVAAMLVKVGATSEALELATEHKLGRIVEALRSL